MDLSHLTSASRAAAKLPNAERITRIRADRWIGYTRARTAIQRLEELFAWPNKQRMPNVLIIGPTNNGKSMIIEKFRRDHPAVKSERVPGVEQDIDDHIDSEHELIPIVVMQMPSDPAVARFYAMLIASTGHIPYPRIRTADLEHIALRRLRDRRDCKTSYRGRDRGCQHG